MTTQDGCVGSSACAVLDFGQSHSLTNPKPIPKGFLAGATETKCSKTIASALGIATRAHAQTDKDDARMLSDSWPAALAT